MQFKGSDFAGAGDAIPDRDQSTKNGFISGIVRYTSLEGGTIL
jgi:hypothetical protein